MLHVVCTPPCSVSCPSRQKQGRCELRHPLSHLVTSGVCCAVFLAFTALLLLFCLLRIRMSQHAPCDGSRGVRTSHAAGSKAHNQQPHQCPSRRLEDIGDCSMMSAAESRLLVSPVSTPGGGQWGSFSGATTHSTRGGASASPGSAILQSSVRDSAEADRNPSFTGAANLQANDCGSVRSDRSNRSNRSLKRSPNATSIPLRSHSVLPGTISEVASHDRTFDRISIMRQGFPLSNSHHASPHMRHTIHGLNSLHEDCNGESGSEDEDREARHANAWQFLSEGPATGRRVNACRQMVGIGAKSGLDQLVLPRSEPASVPIKPPGLDQPVMPKSAQHVVSKPSSKHSTHSTQSTQSTRSAPPLVPSVPSMHNPQDMRSIRASIRYAMQHDSSTEDSTSFASGSDGSISVAREAMLPSGSTQHDSSATHALSTAEQSASKSDLQEKPEQSPGAGSGAVREAGQAARIKQLSALHIEKNATLSPVRKSKSKLSIDAGMNLSIVCQCCRHACMHAGDMKHA